ncbi:WAP four-disulfide core domain protein 3-like isoform X1 [Biomphalaria pfeifferi]|uniref:WAP four-disulfide core domain protein 3-like isoform X1 n=1 Tax=Biomphalaria pfeifferi TaxID=112525 RepID=A0AAD8B748_BIOPF|nr:WAP four-disulfide core domain protein 3-like isoform X1 [Biomphalaria pfeifferi]
MMCFAIVFILLIGAPVGMSAATIGLCAEMCNSGWLLRSLGASSCPEGYECRSNGCGHACVRIVGITALSEPCPPYCECPEGKRCHVGNNICGFYCGL